MNVKQIQLQGDMERGAELFKDDILRGISLAIKNVSGMNFQHTFLLFGRRCRLLKKCF